MLDAGWLAFRRVLEHQASRPVRYRLVRKAVRRDGDVHDSYRATSGQRGSHAYDRRDADQWSTRTPMGYQSLLSTTG